MFAWSLKEWRCDCAVCVFQSRRLAPRRGWSQSWWPPRSVSSVCRLSSQLLPTHSNPSAGLQTLKACGRVTSSSALLKGSTCWRLCFDCSSLSQALITQGCLKWALSLFRWIILLQELRCTTVFVTSSLCLYWRVWDPPTPVVCNEKITSNYSVLSDNTCFCPCF